MNNQPHTKFDIYNAGLSINEFLRHLINLDNIMDYHDRKYLVVDITEFSDIDNMYDNIIGFNFYLNENRGGTISIITAISSSPEVDIELDDDLKDKAVILNDYTVQCDTTTLHDEHHQLFDIKYDLFSTKSEIRNRLVATMYNMEFESILDFEPIVRIIANIIRKNSNKA